ncbi:MAG: PEGA domain-containing protein [Candidatus Schekmanbacteria bacterium]|nr:PEGA domain-containing protein [Candidatus Schekmanbacteria bacterium]
MTTQRASHSPVFVLLAGALALAVGLLAGGSAPARAADKSTTTTTTVTSVGKEKKKEQGHSSTSSTSRSPRSSSSSSSSATPRSSITRDSDAGERHSDRPRPSTTIERHRDRSHRYYSHRPHHHYIYWGTPWWWWYDDYYYDSYYYPPRYVYPSYYSPYGYIETHVEPEEAWVYVDGDYVGEADDLDGWPDRLVLEPGRHTLEFRLRGYRSLVVDVYISRGKTLRLSYTLMHGGGYERLTRGEPPRDPEPWAEPRDYGDADRDDEKSRGPERYGSATVPPPGNERERPSVPDPESAQAGAYSDEERVGTLKLKISPENSAIYIDGEFWGTARGADWGYLYLAPGEHAIEVTHPRAGSTRKTVKIEVDKEQSLEIRLTSK